MAELNCDLLIAGAGPAGLATALYLLRDHPEFKGRVVALEKSRHPRFKTCAGGLIPKTLLALRELGLVLEVPAVEVMRGTARTELGEVDLWRRDPLCTVIRRDEFDARLARAAVAAGLKLIENCRVTGVEQADGGVRVATDRGSMATSVLVGADGSGSRTRACVFGRKKQALGRALMTDVAVDPERTPEFLERRYRFDFRCVSSGIRGYAWSFPCLIGGRPHLNLGIYDQFAAHGASGRGTSRMIAQLKAAFPEAGLDRLGTPDLALRAFPIRWFHAADHFVNGRVLLAGDAAGVDPLMGEGISCAFEHGKLAARAAAAFLSGDRAALHWYDAELRGGAVGRKMKKLSFAARHFYGPHHRFYFRLAGLSRRAQEVGVDWFNGTAHFDELPTRVLIARWLRAVLFGVAVR